jgi:uncharacterized protein (TIGR02145 family)
MKFTIYLFSIALLSICNVVQAQIRVACMAGDTIELNIAQARGTVQWQASADSLVWTDIPGANSEQIDYHPSAGIQWVRAAISESDCPPFYEHPVRVNAVDTTSAEFDPLIIVMDTVTVQFLPDSAEQAMGQYDFEVTGTNVSIDPGDILIGTEGRGFLVSVDYLIRSNNQLVIQTHLASLDDLFDDASFDLEMLMDSLEQRDFGVQLALNNVQIATDGNLSFSFPSFNYQLTGSSSTAMLYSAAQGTQQLQVDCGYGITLGGEISLVTASPSVPSLLEGDYIFAIYDNTKEIDVDGKPLLYTTQVGLKIEYYLDASYGTSCDLNSSFSNYSDIGYNLTYSPESFFNGFDYNVSPGPDYSLFSNDDECHLDPHSMSYRVTFKTEVSHYFYDQPYLYLDIAEEVIADYNPCFNTETWSKNVYVRPELLDALELDVMGVFDYESTIPEVLPDIYEYEAPFEISLISGALQSAFPDSTLAEPIVVKVKDNQGEPVQHVKILVDISGGGALGQESLLTDAEGKVSLSWTLGNNAFDFQMLSIRPGHCSSDITDTPLEVYAILSTACGGLTTVTDVDGNVYPVIAIGNQCWTQTNLRTTHFSDQTEIPNVADGTAWINSNSPAWCFFDNNEGYDAVSGKLYNWYVAYDSRNVCPVGWHVPSETDFYILLDAVGGYSTAGGALKSLTGWAAPNTGATNSSGFSALPGGTRSNSDDGAFYSPLWVGHFWSTYSFDQSCGYDLGLGSSWVQGLMGTMDKNRGASIRCVKY